MIWRRKGNLCFIGLIPVSHPCTLTAGVFRVGPPLIETRREVGAEVSRAVSTKRKRCKMEKKKKWNLRVQLFRFQRIVDSFCSSIRISGNSVGHFSYIVRIVKKKKKTIVIQSIELFCNGYKVRVELCVTRQQWIKWRLHAQTSCFEVTSLQPSTSTDHFFFFLLTCVGGSTQVLELHVCLRCFVSGTKNKATSYVCQWKVAIRIRTPASRS